jgi:hypothetical protein
MKAQLKSIFSYDISSDSMQTWKPPEHDFGIYVMLFIGIEDDHRSDCFDMLLCTPGWFAHRMDELSIESGQHVMFMKEFDYPTLRAFIEAYVDRCEGASWPEIAEKLGYLAAWEHGHKNFDSRVSPRSISNLSIFDRQSSGPRSGQAPASEL